MVLGVLSTDKMNKNDCAYCDRCITKTKTAITVAPRGFYRISHSQPFQTFYILIPNNNGVKFDYWSGCAISMFIEIAHQVKPQPNDPKLEIKDAT